MKNKTISHVFSKLAVIPLVFFSALVLAEDGKSATAQNTAAIGMDNSQVITQMLLGLGLVVGLIYAMAWLVKRFNFPGLAQAQSIKVIASVPLGRKEKAVLLEVEGVRLLVGVGGQTVTTLKDFESATTRTSGATADSSENYQNSGSEFNEQEIDADKNIVPVSHVNIEPTARKQPLGAQSFSKFLKKVLQNNAQQNKD